MLTQYIYQELKDFIEHADPWYWLIVAVLSVIGLVFVTSSSLDIGANRGAPFFFVYRHAIYLVLGMILCLVVVRVPMSFWENQSWLLLGLAFVLLVLVITPNVGLQINGSSRWLGIGSLTLQASEPAKLFALVYLAAYLVRRQDEVRHRWSGLLKPIIVTCLLTVLLLAEPDFGAVLVLLSASLGMMFLGGVRIGQFVLLVVVSSLLMVATAFSQAYRLKRLSTFMDPWSPEHVYAGGYQLTQSLIAFGRGEWFGVGLGNSIQKLFYLPEAYTDFVFAIIAEESGLLGVFSVIALFVAFIYRSFKVAYAAETCGQLFSAYLAYGIAILFSVQIFINLGVNTGILPTKGLTLPFLSYGGSSLLMCFVAVGLIGRIDRETQALRNSST